ncbi:hypothetical protein [Salinicoccus halodurans]|uniref:Uncharacterized protein n=1 Tax=Salinicoccus halodurans TaxID=407035 RepID=A0AA94KXT7_9STAP|nr:hypothetical protein [Salinicoccus halodurans]SFK96271.1 hypothetical protein SAMN05216235_2826 [Salinicoccus halodurans]
MTYPVLRDKVAIKTGSAIGMGKAAVEFYEGASLWFSSDASSSITGTTIHAEAVYTSR